MTLEVDTELRSEILSKCRSGELLANLSERRWESSESRNQPAVTAAADIHNAGDFDLLAEFRTARLADLSGNRFFQAQRFFCELLPFLNGTIEDVSQSVRDMVERGGHDMMANAPNNAFRDWCARDAHRPELALEIARSDLDFDTALLTFALEAGAVFDCDKYVTEAIKLSSEPLAHIRLHAITALGRIDCSHDPDLHRKVLAHLATVVENAQDDNELAVATGCLLDRYVSDENLDSPEIETVLRAAADKAGDATQCALADALRRHGNHLPAGLRDIILSALVIIDPANKGTINLLDVALTGMDAEEDWRTIADHIHAMISGPASEIQLKDFDSLTHDLRTNPGLLHRLLIHWLVSGDAFACRQIASQATEVGRDATPVDIDFPNMGLSDTELVALCARALGFLELSPVTAASILVAAIRTASAPAQAEIGELLFDPLLINYSGVAESYLDDIANDSGDLANLTVNNALERRKLYLDDLRSVGNLPELHPSNDNRRAAAERQRDVQSAANKAADEFSVLSKLVPRSLLLYGNSSATYADRENSGTLSRNYMKLATFTTSVEIPRLEIYDPVGFSYRCLRFRRTRQLP